MLETEPGREYDESVFRYFLDNEKARTTRSNRELRLLLATFEPFGKPVPMEPRASACLFSALGQSLRETDVMGWYRQDLVVGAVLSPRDDIEESDIVNTILRRVGAVLREQLPSKVAGSLRLQVCPLPPRIDAGVGHG